MNSNKEINESTKNESTKNIEINNINENIKLKNFQNIVTNNEKLRMKKNIIMKISNQLINNRINENQNDFNNLDFIQIIDILNTLDKSFSSYSFKGDKSFGDDNDNEQNDDIYYQKELNIIKNIYMKLIKDYDITFNESFELINQKFINISNKQNNSKAQNKYNNNYYCIYNYFYDFIILFLLLNKNDINNKKISMLSPVDRIFTCEDQKEQKMICKIINNYLDINSFINKDNINQELRSIYHVILLFSKINLLKQKIKSNNNICSSKKYEENKNYFNESNNEIKVDESKAKKNHYNNLSNEDFCKIILKKDFIINQLETKIENLNRTTNNENTFRDLEDENDINKKEIEEMKKMYDLEFELMASAIYGLGINLFFNKEQQHNEQIINNSSWLSRQKDYIMELND
jgi:hypothetical protein